MRRPRWIASPWRLDALQQLAGVLPAAAVVGLTLVWLGKRVRWRVRRVLGRILNGPRDAALLYVAGRLGPEELRHLRLQSPLKDRLHHTPQRVLSLTNRRLPKSQQIPTIISPSRLGTSFRNRFHRTWRC